MLEIHNYVTPFILLLFVFTVSFAVLGSKPFQKEEKDSKLICTECFTVSSGAYQKKGNLLIGILLFMLGVIPGLIYSVWRSSSSNIVCPCCKHDNLIPIDSPKGKKLLSEINSNCEYQC